MHSPASVAGTQAGKDWSAAAKTTGRPPLPATALCGPETQVLHVFLPISKDADEVVLSLMLCTILHLRTRSSPPLVNVVLVPAFSVVVGDGFNCRRHDAALLAAITVACPLPISSSIQVLAGENPDSESNSVLLSSSLKTDSLADSVSMALADSASVALTALMPLSSVSLSSSRRDSSISSSFFSLSTRAFSITSLSNWALVRMAAMTGGLVLLALAAPAPGPPSPVPGPIIILSFNNSF